MDIVKLIVERRTVHTYSTEVVPDSILKKAVEMALYAPNHHMTLPYKFFRVSHEFRSEIGEVAIAKKAAKASPPMSETAKSAVRKKYTEGGELIVAGITKNSDPEIEREDFASLAMALQNMSLYLWSEGYGSKWSSGGIIKHPLVYKEIGENPEEFAVCAFFWIGKAAGAVRPIPRPPVEKFYFETGK
ncbi:MAG: nitroreductase family protein [Bdellovibrionota bacterium]